MKAVNLTLTPLELAAVNGPGLLRRASAEPGGGRELVEVTDREWALHRAGKIALVGEPTEDAYDGMDREDLAAATETRGLTVTREDGREDLEPTLNELRHALRANDAETGGAS